MNFIDVIIIGSLAWSGYSGYKSGFIYQLTSLMAFGGGLIIAALLVNPIAHILTHIFKMEMLYSQIIVFIILFVLTVTGINILGSYLDEKAKLKTTGKANKIAGSAFAVIKTFLLICVFLTILYDVINEYPIISPKSANRSLLFSPMAKVVPAIFPEINFEGLNRYLDKQT